MCAPRRVHVNVGSGVLQKQEGNRTLLSLSLFLFDFALCFSFLYQTDSLLLFLRMFRFFINARVTFYIYICLCDTSPLNVHLLQEVIHI